MIHPQLLLNSICNCQSKDVNLTLIAVISLVGSVFCFACCFIVRDGWHSRRNQNERSFASVVPHSGTPDITQVESPQPSRVFYA